MHDALPLLLLVLLISTLLLGSCGLLSSDGSSNTETQANSTYLRATLNGEEAWSGENERAFFVENGDNRWLTIAADTVSEQQYPYTESLTFVAIFRGTGTYSLVEVEHEWDETGTSYYEIDGDALISSYHATDDTSSNQLTITSYDSTASIMTGTFRTTVVVDSAQRVSEPGEPPRHRPDTLRFTDGTFRLKVVHRE